MLGRYKIFSISIGYGYLSICYPPILVIIIIIIKSHVISYKDILKINLMINFNMGRYVPILIFIKYLNISQSS